MQKAKVFRNGRSQAIRLPKEFRVDAREVYLRKTSDGFLVTSRDVWDMFFEGIQEISEDFMAKGRRQPDMQERRG
jgi:antitoxin VapB